MEAIVDRVHQADALREEMKGANAAMGDAADALRDFVMDVAGGENGPMAANRPGLVEPALDSALASAEPIS
jgi:hypothetical protein